MSVRIGTGLSRLGQPRAAALDAASAAAAELGVARCDLAVVFASGTVLGAPELVLEAVHEILQPDGVIGCGAGGVIGHGQEVEDGTAVSVWAATLGDGTATTFHAAVEELEAGTGALTGMADLTGADGAILIAEPETFPTDAVLRFLSESTPMLPLIGGLASGRSLDDEAVLFIDERVVTDGAVGVRLDGVEMLPAVSQGAAPIGPELTITAGEGRVIGELAGKPALEKLRDTIEELPPEELQLVQGGLLMGIVVDANKPDYLQGDFLVRGLLGADPDTGQVALAADIHPGQVVRLHARDAESAGRDLREALSIRMTALGGRTPAGALLFACNGRGRGMFGREGHDVEAVSESLAGAPAAGFFAAGEIGPVGGGYFLHSFTATVAVFA
ncbi:FIST C-terminal domain-containing protein [Solirubrobacter sp. CPCC 204708]|uniref:FIST C-terminal domain-containing protein n=1 Tax=Solirubrobacter deserti TaxID=2282478 RepID=A0ABT4RHH3_9ACTN|nr:FIST N-terminal domain-containing protein [Solirubrobacter deserti]MBE2315312.1 FIST C-terminal domain-containing protein [Solirubrobacter deserti]MDA0137997.1 FIST C-terminal domain-containing protein [Solirubrobacter deserti]